jgi:Protein of unknown function (DUF3311)
MVTGTASREPAAAAPSRRHRWLLLLPFAWQVGCVPLVNDVAWQPFGLPFPMAWQMAGILFTTAVIAVVFAIDRRLDAAAALAAAAGSAPDPDRR